MNSFHLVIYEADNIFYKGEVTSLVVPAIDGEYGVLAGHYDCVVAVEEGIIRFTTAENAGKGNSLKGVIELEADKNYSACVATGMMRIEKGEAMMLVDSAEWPDEIDLDRALRAQAAAKEAMLQKKSIQEYAQAEASLRRAMMRLKVKNNQ